MSDISNVGSLALLVVPMAVGAALSPTLFAAVTALLSSKDHPRTRALAFLVGALIALVVVSLLVFTALGPLIVNAYHSVSSILAIIDIVLGVVLLALSGRFLLRPPHRRTHPSKGPRPIWRNGLAGLVLQGRDVSSMILFYTAQQHVAVATVSDETKLVAAVVVIAITSAPDWLPIVTHLTIPASLQRRMDRARDWVVAHQGPVASGVCLVFGTYLIVRGALGS